MKNKIPIKQCKNGYYYLIDARNAQSGIYNSKDKSFIISRKKFGSVFLSKEYHFDTGSPFGTAIPLKELEKAPDALSWSQAASYDCLVVDNQKMLDWIAEAEIRYNIEFERQKKIINKFFITCSKEVSWDSIAKTTDEDTLEKLKKWVESLA